MSSIKILRNDAFHALAGLNPRKRTSTQVCLFLNIVLPLADLLSCIEKRKNGETDAVITITIIIIIIITITITIIIIIIIIITIVIICYDFLVGTTPGSNLTYTVHGLRDSLLPGSPAEEAGPVKFVGK
ncbi:hypothetical protein E2C01_036080 [Portunus trituberculatus]|uniref:Uncharacterized protein n=1 Tax=Portunus trituberculatus TaxID=210409 RepID=A0A5B7FBH2_PORTR|nr:hypothetical protein [Portunus trituberculatus]